jgi:outer membrane receptor protein involved in Fe transport
MRKLLLSILAVVLAVFMPLVASSQIAPEKPHRAAPTEPAKKYEIFAGYGYTAINQINQSRYGLQGVNVSVTRDWGRFFGVTADGAYYKWPLLQNSKDPNPGNPMVETILLGPVLHSHIAGPIDGFFHVLLGVNHTTDDPNYTTPDISFSGGVGGGLDYKLSPHFSLRASGDDLASSFSSNASSTSCSKTGGCSPHKRYSVRAAFGVVYKF